MYRKDLEKSHRRTEREPLAQGGEGGSRTPRAAGRGRSQLLWGAVVLVGVCALVAPVSKAIRWPAAHIRPAPLLSLVGGVGGGMAGGSGSTGGVAVTATPQISGPTACPPHCVGLAGYKWADSGVCAEVEQCDTGGCEDRQTPFCSILDSKINHGTGSQWWGEVINATVDKGLWKRPDLPKLTAATGAQCSKAFESLRASVPRFKLQSRHEALRLLSGKRIVFTGDSLLKETFRELCDYLGAQWHWSPKTKDTTGHHTGGHCVAAAADPAARVVVRFDWNLERAKLIGLCGYLQAFGDYPPLPLTNAELGGCGGSAGNRSYYTDLDQPGCVENPEACPMDHLVDIAADFDIVVVSTGLWHVAPTCHLNSAQPLRSIRAMAASLFNSSNTTKQPLMILRSNPTTGFPNTWKDWDIAAGNKYLLDVRDGMAELVADFGPQRNLQFVDGTSFSLDTETGYRTDCPYFSASLDQCGCHMGHKYGWAALVQQILSVVADHSASATNGAQV